MVRLRGLWRELVPIPLVDFLRLALVDAGSPRADFAGLVAAAVRLLHRVLRLDVFHAVSLLIRVAAAPTRRAVLTFDET